MLRAALHDVPFYNNIRLLLLSLLTSHLSLPANAQTTAPPAGSVAPAGQAAPVVSMPPDTAGVARGWQLVRSVALPQPGAASLDRRGNFYVTDRQNNLRQFGPDGQALNVYAPPLPGHVMQVEAWNTAKILVFYDDRQQVLLLDRFLSPISELPLPQLLDGQARVVTLAPDDRYWLFNESDLTLRQFDAGQKRFTITTPLDILIGRSRPDFRFLREYQNNLYLVDRVGGVYVFDNLGNFRKKLPLPGLSYVGFRGDELYYLGPAGELRFFHLYHLTERARPLPITGVQQVLVSDQYAYLLTEAGVQVYKIPGR
ncbi:hypothetical protein [Hymenobacter actinosclerus]|uniref:NHL repeat-containing protein n=1 Tax=Hymenobacter actinosclerus TaxID=82805 RepID=A0A1I0H4N2_9BACT|nr:hypothetical protein [Hymenobacter actinosclerus]SET77794.1 hypothetical protein SAMN04487998_2720 [Hymenobacter actinosclerus]